MNSTVRKPTTLAGRILSRLMVATLVASTPLVVASAADAALTTGKCLGQKRTVWITLRKCQGVEQVKLLNRKPTDLAKCQTKFQEKLAKISAMAAKAVIPCRYRDNGDLTVTDYDTGLQWERKNDFGSTANPNHVDNVYMWSKLGSTLADGTVFTDFLARLNGSVASGFLSISFVEACTSTDGQTVAGGFAGHCDWRLPTVAELRTILDSTQGKCGGGSGACIDPVFGPAVAFIYWSATTFATLPDYAWFVLFDDGYVGPYGKNNVGYVRAVRTGL